MMESYLCVFFPGESPLVVSPAQCKSVQVDLTGMPRRTKVRLPSCILSSKPHSVPNQQVEPCCRRTCQTSHDLHHIH